MDAMCKCKKCGASSEDTIDKKLCRDCLDDYNSKFGELDYLKSEARWVSGFREKNWERIKFLEEECKKYQDLYEENTSKKMIFDQTGAVEVDCSGIGNVQLYAKIKKSSKYFAQNEYAKSHKEMGFPFPVTITNQHYMYLGGPGDRYRKEDLNIFVKIGNDFVRIS